MLSERVVLAATLAGLAGVVIGCGGAEPPVRQKIVADDHRDRRVPPDPDADDDDDNDGVEIEGLRGHLDATDIRAGIEPHHAELTACFTSRVGRRRFLGGQIELAWRVARDGAVKQVQIAAGDLGAWPIEKCLLEVSRAMTFAPPTGGEAEFSLPLDFPPRGAVEVWDEVRIATEIDPRREELADCDGASDDVLVTLYVGTRGQVQSVGFAAPGGARAYSDAWADCAAATIGDWTLSDPRGKVAKLAFRYAP